MKQFARAFVFGTALAIFVIASGSAADKAVRVPTTWDDEALAWWQLPLVARESQPVLLTSQQFYRLPELKIYKSYPVYAPGKEPAGYMDQLRTFEPKVVFDAG